MRDKLTNGEPDSTSCTPFNRGRTFVTADGTSATFISDTDIFDYPYSSPPSEIQGSGYILLRDGTRFRIDGNKCVWMRDRNGNKLNFSSSNGVTLITDSIGRQVSVINTITVDYKGFGGAARIIQRQGASLGEALRSGFSLRTERDLFPQLNDSSALVVVNPGVTSSITLPNNQQYKFYYNSYAEVARVELPTGGAIEYDYAPGLTDGPESGYMYLGVVGGHHVYRRVVERRVYPDGGSGSSFAMRTTYSRPESGSSNAGYVQTDQYDSAGAFLGSQRHYFYGSARDSFGKQPTRYSPWQEGLEYQTDDLAADRATVLRRGTFTWSQPAAGAHWPLTQPETQAGAKPNDPHITETVTTLFDVTPNLASKKTFAYDEYNNQTDVYEYDFGPDAPGPLIRRTHMDYVTLNNGVDYAAETNIHIRNLPLRKQFFDAGGTKRAETFYEYDLYDNSPNHAQLIDRLGISGLDSGFTTGYTTRGNVTRTSSALLNNSGGVTGWVNSHAQFDIAGSVVKAIDANDKPTTFDFSDRFGSPGDDAQQNTPPAELNGQTAYAFATKVTNALGHTAYTKYDYYLGEPVNTEDANGIVSSVAYNDALDRPTQAIQARYKVTTPPCEPPSVCVSAERRQTTITYDDTNHVTTTTSDRAAFNDNILTSKSYYDGLGRAWRGAAYEGSTWTINDTKFDALGRVSQVSNPYRASDPGSAWPPAGSLTTTEYDALGRPIKLTTPDGAPVDTAYSGNKTLAIDQAGKKQISRTDALGRLTNVWEVRSPDATSGTVSVSFPNHPEITAGYQTDYSYDTLDNLIEVNQGGQHRYFFYDSLGRLVRAKNPEQSSNSSLNLANPPAYNNNWSLAYSYDANGNLVSKTDARNITTTYGYDWLNRNTTVSYSDSTPGITRTYDTAALGKGRLQKTETAGSMGSRVTINDYDAMGRPLSQSQQFFNLGAWGTSYTTRQTYDLAGNVKTLTYPSLHAVNQSYDQAGRLSSFSGNLGGSPSTYADMISYNAAGQMIKERFGANTPLYHNLHYNNRQQLVDTRLGDSATDELNRSRGSITFLYGTNAVANGDMFANDTDNNGNLRRQINYVPLAGGGNVIPQQHDYTYDALNRIATIRERQRNVSGQWSDSVSQAYSYDRWGNRTLDLSGGGSTVEGVWVDDALPAGAVPGADGGDSWNWISSSPSPLSGSVSHISNIADTAWSPPPYSGNVSHQSNISSGFHQHYFGASATSYPVRNGGKLYAYIYIDPANPTDEVLLQWWEPTQGWEHRAYWGANVMGFGTDGTQSRRYMGPLPAAGGWVRLEVPASAVGLEGLTVGAMAFTLYGGRANWDLAGVEGWTTVPDHMECVWNGVDNDCYWVYRDVYENFAIVDDSIPAGAAAYGDGGDGWYWTGARTPQPFHQHYFYGATNTLNVNAGDTLYTWAYLDLANPPEEIMLQWNDGSWEHRAYWGANKLGWGVDGTASRKYMGGLPAGGGWVKLEVPASAVGLEGKTVNGMAFTLYGGRAAWDKAGKVSPGPLAGAGPPINNRVYTVDATTNRLQPPSGSGTMQYDAAGNLEIDPYTSGTSQLFVYDGENRLVEAKNSAGVTVSRYIYDAGGRRVRRIIGGQETWLVYGIEGELLAEYQLVSGTPTLKKEYGYRGGQMLVVWDGSETGDRQLQWLVQDHLGSTRMVVDRSGSLGGVRRHDFAPFGEELFAGVGIRSASNGYSGDSVRQKFGSKERDIETGLDYFIARYHSSIQGRFTSVDPENAGSDPEDPQSWNGYAYTRNNPVLYSDPDGRKYFVCSAEGVHCGFVSDREFLLDRAGLESQGLVFTGGRGFMSEGLILFNGEVQATYAQFSIDDRAYEFVFHMQVHLKSRELYQRAFTSAILSAIIGHSLNRQPTPKGGYRGTPRRFTPKKLEVPELTRDGKVHNEIPKYVPKEWTRSDLEQARDNLQHSIKTRQNEQIRLGEDGPHRERLRQETQLLKQVEKKLSGS